MFISFCVRFVFLAIRLCLSRCEDSVCSLFRRRGLTIGNLSFGEKVAVTMMMEMIMKVMIR